MDTTMLKIGALQTRLNALMATSHLYTDSVTEIYALSQQLDALILAYYTEGHQ